MTFWLTGFLALWLSGFLAFWLSGFLVFWFSGFGLLDLRFGFFVVCFLRLAFGFGLLAFGFWLSSGGSVARYVLAFGHTHLRTFVCRYVRTYVCTM